MSLLSLSITSAVSSLLSCSYTTIPIIWATHYLTSDEIAGVALGSTIYNTVCLSIYVGLSLGFMPDLATFKGEKNHQRFAVTLWWMICLFTLLSIVTIVGNYFLSNHLGILGQKGAIAIYTRQFMQIRNFSIFFEAIEIILHRVSLIFEIKSALWISSIVTFVWLSISIGLSLQLGWGISGIAICLLSYNILKTSIYLLIMADRVEPKYYQIKLSDMAMQSCLGFKLVYYGMVASIPLFVEWWSAEFCQVVSGYISVDSATACGILYSIILAVFYIPLGVSYASSSIIGNAIGKKSVNIRKQAWICLILGYSSTFIPAALIILFKHYWPLWVSPKMQQSNVTQLLYNMAELVAFYIILDGGKCCLSSILRAAKYFKLSTIITLISYAIGVPLAIILALDKSYHYSIPELGTISGVGWGLRGLWSGLTIASIISNITQLLWMCLYRWDTGANAPDNKDYQELEMQA